MGSKSPASKPGLKIAADSRFSFASASSDAAGNALELDCHELLSATINGSAYMCEIWPHFGQRKCSSGREKSSDGPKKSSGDHPEKSLMNGLKRECHGPMVKSEDTGKVLSEEDPDRSLNGLRKEFHGPKMTSNASGKGAEASGKGPEASIKIPGKAPDASGNTLDGAKPILDSPAMRLHLSQNSLDRPGKSPDGLNGPAATSNGSGKSSEASRKSSDGPKNVSDGPAMLLHCPGNNHEAPRKSLEACGKSPDGPKNVSDGPALMLHRSEKSLDERLEGSSGPGNSSLAPEKPSDAPQKSSMPNKKGLSAMHSEKSLDEALKSPDSSSFAPEKPSDGLQKNSMLNKKGLSAIHIEKSLDEPLKSSGNSSLAPEKPSDDIQKNSMLNKKGLCSEKNLDEPLKSLDGSSGTGNSSLAPEKPSDGLQKNSVLNKKGVCANHSDNISKVKLESSNSVMPPTTDSHNNGCHKTPSSSVEIVEKKNQSDKKIATAGNVESEAVHTDTSLCENQSLWKPWTQSEVYTLVSAVEECCLLYQAWDLDNNTKWDIILKHINKDGYVFQRSESTARAKFYSLIRGFKDIKIWKSLDKLPSYDNMTFKQRTATGLPRCFSKELYARMQTFFDVTGIDDGVPGASKSGEEEQIIGYRGGRITRGQLAAVNASKDGNSTNSINNPSIMLSEQHDVSSEDFHENAYVNNEGIRTADPPLFDEKRRAIISTEVVHADRHFFPGDKTASPEETHTTTQSFHGEKTGTSPQSVHEEEMISPQETCINNQRDRKNPSKSKSFDCGSPWNMSQRSHGMVGNKKRKHVPDDYGYGGSPPLNHQQTSGIATEKVFANKKKYRTPDKQAGSSSPAGVSQQTNQTPRSQKKATKGSEPCCACDCAFNTMLASHLKSTTNQLSAYIQAVKMNIETMSEFVTKHFD